MICNSILNLYSKSITVSPVDNLLITTVLFVVSEVEIIFLYLQRGVKFVGKYPKITCIKWIFNIGIGY